MGVTVSPQTHMDEGLRGKWTDEGCVECRVRNVDDEEQGIVLPSVPAAPYIPTRQEKLEHEVIHFPY